MSDNGVRVDIDLVLSLQIAQEGECDRSETDFTTSGRS